MYKKLQSLKSLQNAGLNIFPYCIPKTPEQLNQLAQLYGKLTLRFDCIEDLDNLPFYIIDNLTPFTEICTIFKEATDKKCIIIASNGIQYDAIQCYNLVIRFEVDGSFIAEASPEKVPLRKMYNYPLLRICGNVTEALRYWNFNEYYGIDRRRVRDTILSLYDLHLYRKWIECTVYPVCVGIHKQNIIFWQLN